MSRLLIEALVLAIVPVGLYFIARRNPAAASLMGKYPGIFILVAIVGVILMISLFRFAVIDPCLATTRPHTVTDNLGRAYTTEYKDSGEWCLWVRGNWPP